MAGDWIKFELNTLDKPEVCQIADLADMDPDAVVGKLMRVWGWFDQQTEDGNAPSVSKKLLDRLVGVAGFCEHMKSVSWMVESDSIISLPNFDRHNGKTAKNRALTAKRVAAHKAGNAKGNAPVVSGALPREEKRREDIKPHSHNAGGEADSGAEENPKEPEASPPTDQPAFDPTAPSAMTLEWEPDQKLLKAYALRFGVPLSAFTPEATAPFVCHHAALGRFEDQAVWVSKLVAWVKRDTEMASKGSRSNVKPFPGQSRHSGFDDRDYTKGLTPRGDGTYDF